MTARRVVLATGGSLGDIHPMMALGLALQARGHRAEIATAADYRAKIEAAGLGFHEVGPSLARLERDTGMNLEALTAKIARSDRFLFEDIMLAYLEESARALLAASAGAAAVVGSTFAPGAGIVAERLGVPHVVASLQPTTVFSTYDPPRLPAAPWLRPARGGAQLWLNRASLWAARRTTAPWTRRVNRVRRRLGAAPTRQDVFFDALSGADLALGLFSPLLSPRQPDAPPRFHVVGYAPYDSEDGRAATLAEPLARFLAEGEPPIVFTLGSAAVNIPGRFYREGLAAARRLGRRAVLLVGPDGDPAVADGSDAVAVPYAPYSLLLPRAAAVVHQGGVGTTQQALRAGRPQLVVPHLGDQYDNAARVVRLGCGAALDRGRFTAARAAERLGALLAGQGARQRAQTVAASARAEDGAAEAVRLIEALLA